MVGLQISRQVQQARVQKDPDFAEWYVEQVMRTQLQQFYWAVSNQGKREMVINGRHWARRYGLSDSEAQAHFISLMWKVGANFFVFPGFVDVVQDTSRNDMSRVEAFYQVDQEQAAEAIIGSDDRFWYPIENGILKEWLA
ncbi:hypothetical protein GFB49_06225 [Epibacterium sp. SM1979]|uniref:Uncharacterized protein n=1 Tax=Tritonibacter litoralis TaxID=2662264 RepID=A0A843YFI2_9RHOB|nr:hypothetical protein [Tritonibacter litoralis]MQQ08042.1 hypothetical protein [Tritonibacter litoralis]